MIKERRWYEKFFLLAQSSKQRVQVIRESSLVFLGVAIAQLFVTSSTFYLVPLLVLTALLWRWHSRMTSLYLFYFCVGFVMVTITDLVAEVGRVGNWFNFLLSLVALWSAVRAFDAASKLQSEGV